MSNVECPRAKSDMTPCVLRDGDLAELDDGRCVGCLVGTPPELREALEDLWGCIGHDEIQHLQPQTVEIARENHQLLAHGDELTENE